MIRVRLFLLSLLLTAVSVSSHAGRPADDKHSPSGFQADLLANIEAARGQIISLEDATPEKTLSWRPAEGVRSVGEVYLHLALANYLILNSCGYEPPADAGYTMDMKKWELRSTDRSDVAARLKKSFDFLSATILKIPESDLEKRVKLPWAEMSLRSALLACATHIHEHLGQSIAYARMNGIVPPWTAEEQKRSEEKKK